MRPWTPLLLAAALAGQSAPVSRSPETRLAEARAAVIQARLERDALARRREEVAVTDELRRLEAEAALRAARQEAADAPADAERAALARAAALNAARQSAAGVAGANARAELEADLRIAQLEASLVSARVDGDLALHRARERLADIAPAAKVEYPLDPVVDGTLRISDRRIPVNGRVDAALADLVTERLAFLNAQDPAKPIFLVMDNCPGGSVMSGYLILRAMEASRAPVYVVVKGSAASMGAVIATLAKRSFCYPGTLLLHHQPSAPLQGNLTQLRESLDWSKVWCDRINAEVAAKMGIGLDEFVRRMYAASVTGDWRATGVEAKALGWVTDVVDRMVEDGVNRLPEPAAAPRVVIVIRGENGAEAEAPVLPGDISLLYQPDQPTR